MSLKQVEAAVWGQELKKNQFTRVWPKKTLHSSDKNTCHQCQIWDNKPRSLCGKKTDCRGFFSVLSRAIRHKMWIYWKGKAKIWKRQNLVFCSRSERMRWISYKELCQFCRHPALRVEPQNAIFLPHRRCARRPQCVPFPLSYIAQWLVLWNWGTFEFCI